MELFSYLLRSSQKYWRDGGELKTMPISMIAAKIRVLEHAVEERDKRIRVLEAENEELAKRPRIMPKSGPQPEPPAGGPRDSGYSDNMVATSTPIGDFDLFESSYSSDGEADSSVDI